MKYLFILVPILLASCSYSSSSSSPKWFKWVIDERGDFKHIVVCRRTSQCYERARWICQGTYTINERNTRVDGVTYSSNSYSSSRHNKLFNYTSNKGRSSSHSHQKIRIEWLIDCDND